MFLYFGVGGGDLDLDSWRGLYYVGGFVVEDRRPQAEWGWRAKGAGGTP